MIAQKIIVVGSSAGGIAALQALVCALPADINAAVCVVQHVGRQRSELPELLSRAGPLPAIHAVDDMALVAGHIYVAPPDYHLRIRDGHLSLNRGPRENFSRPAIDPLFRSAAAAYGPNACGVILTGRLNDGTPGLYELKLRGGTAIVQSPEDALYPDMPSSALEHVAVDYCLPLADMAPVLARFAAAAATRPPKSQPTQEATSMTEHVLERPVALGCPDCGGALRRIDRGTLTQYRCHIGHSYTAEAMVKGQYDDMERCIGAALRLINERAEMCRQMAERTDITDQATQKTWYAAVCEAEQRADAINELLATGWLAPDPTPKPTPV